MSQSNVEDLYLESYAFTTAAAIVGSVDRKVFVALRDGRNYFGILRTFDQYANLVLQDTVERIHLRETNQFAEEARGILIIRGENVVMLGELDIDKEDAPLEHIQQISFKDAERILEQQNTEIIKKESTKAKQLQKLGLTSDYTRGDLY